MRFSEYCIIFLCSQALVFAYSVEKAPTCGVKVIEHIEGNGGKIIGGTEARPGSWPWQLSFRLQDYEHLESGGHFCGATLIAPQWAITAGHCVSMPGYRDPENLRVVAGAHNTDKIDPYEQSADIECIYKHENWNMLLGLDNDIAVLKLKKPLELNDFVSTVCLPPQDYVLPTDAECYATGWGAYVDYLVEEAVVSTVLKQAQLPVWEWQTCKRATLLHRLFLTENMFCVGGTGGHGTCKGDSGGPFNCLYNGAWTNFGATSWGFGCGRDDNPGVYAKVSSYTGSIEKLLAENPSNDAQKFDVWEITCLKES